jgi:hypothetical protein
VARSAGLLASAVWFVDCADTPKLTSATASTLNPVRHIWMDGFTPVFSHNFAVINMLIFNFSAWAFR